METKNSELIGKFINRYLHSDIKPAGKIIGTRGKTILILAKVTAVLNPSFKPEFIPGGFSSVCINSHQQDWIYTVNEDEIFEMRWTPGKTKMGFLHIEDEPCNYYDYNF